MVSNVKRLESDLSRVGDGVSHLLDRVRSMSKSKESVALQAAVATLYNGNITTIAPKESASGVQDKTEHDESKDEGGEENRPTISGIHHHHESILKSLRNMERHRMY